MATFLDIANNPQNRVIIHGVQDQRLIRGFVAGALSFNSNAGYIGGRSSSYEDTLSGAASAGVEMANRLTNASLQKPYIKGIQSTVMQWSGTENFEFQVPMLFLALNETDDVRILPTYLMMACSPDFDVTNKATFLVKAPNNYSASNVNAQGARGLVSVNIGRWFRTDQKFLITGVAESYSKEMVASTGLPLYVEVTVKFTSFRVLSRREIKGMFTSQRGTA